MKRNAQSALQIIFGLFILLIVTLVILGIFFKTTEKGKAGMEGAPAEYFKKAEIEKAVAECENLCQAAVDVDSAIEFCKKVQKIDFNGNGMVGKELADRGRWQFCEDHIPCFIVADCSDKNYGAEGCANILKQNRMDLYEKTKGTYDPRKWAGDLDMAEEKKLGCGIDQYETDPVTFNRARYTDWYSLFVK